MGRNRSVYSVACAKWLLALAPEARTSLAPNTSQPLGLMMVLSHPLYSPLVVEESGDELTTIEDSQIGKPKAGKGGSQNAER